MTLFKQDWITHFQKMGIKANMTLCVSGQHPAFFNTINQHAAIIDALIAILGYDGTLIYMSFDPSQSEPAFLSEVELEHHQQIKDDLKSAQQLLPFSDLFAMSLLTRKDVVINRGCAHTFYGIGKYARFITRKVPIHFPLGDRGPLKSCLDLQAMALHFGDDLSSCYPLAYFLQTDKFAPIYLNGGVYEEEGITRWQKYLDRQISEQLLVDTLASYQDSWSNHPFFDEPILLMSMTELSHKINESQ